MRLWSIHPKYLDPKGLVALWREALLAQAVLAGRTRGYTRHPQLARFTSLPLIATYLHEVADEAERRGYTFDRAKVERRRSRRTLTVPRGQVLYEWEHLRAKLRARSPEWHARFTAVELPDPHPLFVIVEGAVAEWERTR